MLKKVIKIDEDRCVGCGLCASACHQGAIKVVDGKAKLVREDYCDGLGNCLPVCPVEAISFEEVEVENGKSQARKEPVVEVLPCGCPGTNSESLRRDEVSVSKEVLGHEDMPSRLEQWPVQIKLVPVNAPYFDGADLLIAADCTAYAYGSFHEKFMKGKVTLIGCPKLDEGDYAEKLTDILKGNNIRSVTVVRMEVPCCGGLEAAVRRALKDSGKMIPWQVVTVTRDGKLVF